MSFIDTIEPQHATGEVAELYAQLRGNLDYLPNYARLYCHRPAVMAHLVRLQDTLKEHMEPRLWALIALAAARETGSSYCALAFAKRLLRSHFSQQELLAILRGQAHSPLTQGERAAMALAVKLARNAAAVSQHDIDQLHQAGFSDAQVFDVVAAAAWRCFFARVPDALGANPDEDLVHPFESPLLQQLVVGRAVATHSSKRSRARPPVPAHT
jgi:uncharacterized peroxidase-related enzyme